MENEERLLHISFILSVIYAGAVALVIVLQRPIENALGILRVIELPFVIPVSIIFVCIMMIAATIVINILLRRAVDDTRTNIEKVAMVVLSILIVLMPLIFNLSMAMQASYYYRIVGAMGREFEACGFIQQGINICNRILILAMLLQIIHAGISLGKKGC